jgi:hypothetical protein
VAQVKLRVRSSVPFCDGDEFHRGSLQIGRTPTMDLVGLRRNWRERKREAREEVRGYL